MTDVAIFSFGSLMFIATTWATVAFGVRRMHELQDSELESTGRKAQVRDSGLTELHSDASQESDD